MSAPKSNPCTMGLRPEEDAQFRLMRIIFKVCPQALGYILRWGTSKKPHDMSYWEYIMNHPKVSKKQIKVASFFDDETRQIQSVSPEESFDVTLLSKLIRLACDGLASFNDPVWRTRGNARLENLVFMVKDMRDNFLHKGEDHDFGQMIEEIQNILRTAIEIAGTNYGIDPIVISSASHSITERINQIRLSAMITDDVEFYRSEVSSRKLRDMIGSGKGKINSFLKKWVEMETCSSEKFTCVPVSSVYSPMMMYSEPNNVFWCSDLLKRPQVECQKQNVCQHHDLRQQVIVILGESGSGKTILLQHIISQHLDKESQCVTKDLDEYDLILVADFKNSDYTNVEQYVLENLSGSMAGVNKEDLMNALRSLKVLLLVDGLEDQSEFGHLATLLGKWKNTNATFLCVSKPEQFHRFGDMMHQNEFNFSYSYLNKNIDDCAGFFEKHYKFMSGRKHIPQGVSEYIDNCLEKGENCRRTLKSKNDLVLLSFIGVNCPGKLRDISTRSSLYNQMIAIQVEKIVHSLDDIMNTEVTKKKVEQCFEIIFRDSLKAISSGNSGSKTDKIYDRFKEGWLERQLPSEAVPRRQEVFLPYQEAQEFYAARAVADDLSSTPEVDHMELIRTKMQTLNSSIFDSLMDQLKGHRSISKSSVKTTLTKLTGNAIFSDKHTYRNVLRRLLEIVVTQAAPLLNQHGDEILSLLEGGDVWQLHEWLALIQDTSGNQRVTALVADRIKSFKEWALTDADFEVAASLLKIVPPPDVLRLELNDRLSETLAAFQAVLNAVRSSDCIIKINHIFEDSEEVGDQITDFLCTQRLG